MSWPTPCPPGLRLPVAAGEYDGALKVLVNAHKERRQFSLVRPLGAMLAHAVRELVDRSEDVPGGSWFLVPVPSRGRVVRARGHDPMMRVTRQAAGVLRRWGHPVALACLLRSVAVARDQSGLHAGERAANLGGSMRAAAGRAEALRRRWPEARFVVADDVLTTGSTAREAQRALEALGLEVVGVATVAATRKRLPPVTAGTDSGASLPFSNRHD